MKPQSLLLAAILAFVPSVASAMDDNDPNDPNDPDPSEPGEPTTPPPPVAQPTFTKTLTHMNCFPNCTADWSAGYSVNAKLAATPQSATVPKDKLEGWGELDAFARVNGSRYSLFKVRVAGVAEARTRTDLSLTAYVAGAAVFTKPFIAQTGVYVPLSVSQSWTKTFFDKSVSLSVGPVPVSFRAKATGQLGASLTGRISNVGFEAATGPSGKASLFASAAVGGQYCVDYVGCIGASAGLSVNVTLIEASAPVTANLTWSLVNNGWGAQLNYNLTSTLNLKTLAGYLKVFASACLIGCLDWDRTLIDWPGQQGQYTLFNASGKSCLTGQCTMVFQ
jgi:hypothetical protein